MTKKPLVLDLLLATWTQIWARKFFSWILALTDVRHCCKLSLYAVSRKTNEPNLKMAKILVLGPFGPNSGRQNFYSKILFRQSLDILVSYHHIQYLRNLMIQSRENLVTDRRTDGRE